MCFTWTTHILGRVFLGVLFFFLLGRQALASRRELRSRERKSDTRWELGFAALCAFFID